MNRELSLNLLTEIMNWENDIVQEEFRWISFMAAYKYDRYQDYCAGARFLESLITWLQQFETSDRQVAYNFVRNSLIFFSQDEVQRLIEKFYFDCVQPDLLNRVSGKLGIPRHKIWAEEGSIKLLNSEKRKVLFMGLSDGAHIDVLRRLHSKTLVNDQFVITTQIDKAKWANLLEDLRKDLSESTDSKASNEKFSSVYLIDDFIASGTSFLPDPDNTGGKLKGKLSKFAESLAAADSPFEENFQVIIHHYIGTTTAHEAIKLNYQKVKNQFDSYGIKNIRFNFGMVLDDSIRVLDGSSHPFENHCKKYFDLALDAKGLHSKQSGKLSKKFGYAECGLPVVFEHNTPNNSIPLIWADTRGDENNHSMKPLFRRRERHSDTVQDVIEGIEEINGKSV